MNKTDITDHHDGFGLAETMTIYKDAPGPGGASHHYSVDVETNGAVFDVADIQFQSGPRDAESSIPGVIGTAVVAVVLDQLRDFQKNPKFKCRENAVAITKLEEAVMWMQQRARTRAKRGVLGTAKT
jgi:hypothetical protein